MKAGRRKKGITFAPFFASRAFGPARSSPAPCPPRAPARPSRSSRARRARSARAPRPRVALPGRAPAIGASISRVTPGRALFAVSWRGSSSPLTAAATPDDRACPVSVARLPLCTGASSASSTRPGWSEGSVFAASIGANAVGAVSRSRSGFTPSISRPRSEGRPALFVDAASDAALLDTAEPEAVAPPFTEPAAATGAEGATGPLGRAASIFATRLSANPGGARKSAPACFTTSAARSPSCRRSRQSSQSAMCS